MVKASSTLWCRNLQGDLNADYAVRVKKFLAAYEKTPAPAAGYGDHAFKGYEANKGGIIL